MNKKWLTIACGLAILVIATLLLFPRSYPPGSPIGVRSASVTSPERFGPTVATPGPVTARDSEAEPSGSEDSAADYDRELDLFGVVIDAEDEPVVGARVEAISFPWRRVRILDRYRFGQAKVGPTTTTRSDGAFALRLQRGQVVDLRITAAGYAQTTIPSCQAGERVEAVLSEPADVTIVVKRVRGEALPDVEVRIWQLADAGAFGERTGVSDADGSCSFRDLTAGGWAGFLEHPVFCGQEIRFEITESGAQTLEYTMAKGRTLTGYVRDGATGKAVAGARVGADWRMQKAVVTDRNGFYEFRGWSESDGHELHALAEGYGGQGKKVGPEQHSVDFDLSPGDQVLGQLGDENGEPIAGALVAAVATEMTRDGLQQIDSRSVESQADGGFVLRSLRVDLPHTLIIQAKSYGRYLLDFDHRLAAEGVIDLGRVTLPFGQRIEGELVDPSGEPIPHQTLTLTGHNADRGRLRPENLEFAFEEPYGTTETRVTDDLGRFRFADLSPGEYTILVRIPDGVEVQQTIVLGEGENVDDARIVADVGETLHVRVEDEHGDPLSEVLVSVRFQLRGRQREAMAITDVEGEAIVRGLPTTEVLVRVRAGSQYVSPHPRRVRPGPDVATFTIRGAGTVEGIVYGPDGAPLAGMLITAYVAGTEAVVNTVFSDAKGGFSIGVGSETRVDVRVSGARGPGSKPKLEMTRFRGEITEIDVPQKGLQIRTHLIAWDRTVTVQVVDPAGTPVPSVELMASGSGMALRRVVADAEGRVYFSELAPEDILIQWGMRGLPEGAIEPEPLRITPHGQTVTMRCRQGVVVRGRVVDSKGAPVKQAVVEGLNAPHRIVAVTDGSGEFSIALLPGSKTDLRARVVSQADQSLREGWARGVTDRDQVIVVRLGEGRP